MTLLVTTVCICDRCGEMQAKAEEPGLWMDVVAAPLPGWVSVYSSDDANDCPLWCAACWAKAQADSTNRYTIV